MMIALALMDSSIKKQKPQPPILYHKILLPSHKLQTKALPNPAVLTNGGKNVDD